MNSAMWNQRANPSQPIPGWAVLVGINNYTDQFTHPPLECCVRDAIGLYMLLTHPDYGNFAPERVCLMLDGSDDEVRAAARLVVQRLEREYHFSAHPGIVEEIVAKRIKPEREDIMAEIHRAAHNATPEDMLLIHFAGHGYVFDGEVYLIPPRARHPHFFWTAIQLKWVKEEICQSRARRKVLLLDACYSCPPTATSTSLNNAQLTGTLFADTDDVAILASCLPWEMSYEQDDQSGNPLHGIFTYYLLKGLSGKADKAQKGYVALDDLYHYVDDKVKTWVAHNVRQGPLQTLSLNDFGVRQGYRIILSGDRSVAPADEEVAEISSLEADETPPLEVRVWAQPADRRISPVPKQPSAAFRVGEHVCIGFSASRDAYVYLINVSTEGKITQIFPSGVWRENFMRGGETYFIPKENDEFELPVPGPPGVETLIAVATVQPASVFTDWQTAGQAFSLLQRPLSEQDLTRAAQSLSRLPRTQWALGQSQFVVRG